MTDEKKRTITRDTYLQALGLFTLSNKYYLRAQEAQDELNALLGIDDNDRGYISDLLWDNDVKPAQFDEAISKTGITTA